MSQNGGKYLNQGSYGCAFAPAFKCKKKMPDSMYKGSVGKLFFSEESAENEIYLAKQMTKIDPKGDFTVKFKGDCDVQDPNKNKIGIKGGEKSCTLFDGQRQLMYEYGGTSLEKFADKNKNISALLKIVKNSLPILKGLEKIMSFGSTHTDIKPDNMLILKNKLYLIDFGMFDTIDNTMNNSNILEHNYRYYPAELKLYYRYIVGQDRSFAISSIQDIMSVNYDKSHTDPDILNFYKLFDIDLHREIYEMSYQYNLMFSGRIPEFTDYVKHKIVKELDLYSFGMTMAEVYVTITKGIDINKQTKAVQRKLFLIKSWIRIMILPCGMRRVPITDIIQSLKDILNII